MNIHRIRAGRLQKLFFINMKVPNISADKANKNGLTNSVKNAIVTIRFKGKFA